MTSRLCQECHRDLYLAEVTATEGTPEICTHCGNHRQKTLTSFELAKAIFPALQENFRPSFDGEPRNYWSPYSEFKRSSPLATCIYQILGVHVKFLDEIANLMHRIDGVESNERGRRTQFLSGVGFLYTFDPPSQSYYLDQWKELERKLIADPRLENAQGTELLNEIFDDIGFARSRHGRIGDRGLIRSLEAGTNLWRARILSNDFNTRTILPKRDFGPPPAHVTKPGRLHTAENPVLYAAFGPATALLETRPNTGDRAGIIQLQTTRELRVLDLERLDDLYMPFGCSFFSETFRKFYAKVAFFNNLNSRLLASVDENNSELYRPTQFFSRFLATTLIPRIDGIIYSSTKRVGGWNIALFRNSGDLGCDYPATYLESSLDLLSITVEELTGLAAGRRLTPRSSRPTTAGGVSPG